MHIFFATPFTGNIAPQNGRVRRDFEMLVKRVLDSLRAMGHTVFLALEREEWGEALMPPEICSALDYREMRQCDVVVAIPGNPASGGVHVELGWASNMRKPIILLLGEDGQYSPLVHGLPMITNTIKLFYKHSPEEALIYLPGALSEVMKLCSEQNPAEEMYTWRDIAMLKEAWYGKYLQDAEEQLQGRINGVYGGNHQLTATDREKLKHQLRELRKAQLRYQKGTYGLCERCGSEIDWATRKGFPQATVCSHCDLLQSHLYTD